MDIYPIRTKKDFKRALKRIDEIIDAKEGSPEFDELDIISTLVEAYEDIHYPFDPPDPIDAIKFRMEQQGLKRSDIAPLLGGRNRVSEVFSRKRGLSIRMIKNLHTILGIPLESLIRGK